MTSAAASAAVRVAERERVLEAYLGAEQHRLAHACLDLARAFHRGGLLIPFGEGAAASDAAHVTVEFMHPVIVGKRALPAAAPSSDPARGLTVERIGRSGDIALVLAHGPADTTAEAFLAQARDRGLLTIALSGREPALADHAFAVPSDDPAIVQEVQEITYHVLWELVHVFFEHPRLLEEGCLTCGDVAVQARVVSVEGATATVERDGHREAVAIELVEDVKPGAQLLCHAGVALERIDDELEVEEDPSGFLYPFLGGEEQSAETVLADVAASTLSKGAETMALRRMIDFDELASGAQTLRAALVSGGRLLCFGNGGSATDAQDAAFDALDAGWPALALVNDPSTITALGNDVGFENAFARQLIPLGRPGDVALAFSTSGSSPSIIAGLEEAHRRGMVTCALTGYAGGRLAELPWLDHLLSVPGDYVPRLQEVHATMWHLLIEEVGLR